MRARNETLQSAVSERGGKRVKAGRRILGSKDLIGSGGQQMAIESKRLGEETKVT